MKAHIFFMIICLFTVPFFLVSCVQENDISQTEEHLELDSFYESEDYDFLFRYPSQWTIVEEPWHPATETRESDPEKIVDLYIYEKGGDINVLGEAEGIAIFDSMSRDGGLFRLVSGEEEEIVNTLGIMGTMITETREIEGQVWLRVLAYYEEGYTEKIGMGGSYGACATVKKETYEQYGTLIKEILESVHMKQP